MELLATVAGMEERGVSGMFSGVAVDGSPASVVGESVSMETRGEGGLNFCFLADLGFAGGEGAGSLGKLSMEGGRDMAEQEGAEREKRGR